MAGHSKDTFCALYGMHHVQHQCAVVLGLMPLRERHCDLFKSACEQARERDRKAKKGRQDAAVAAAAERQRMEVPSLPSQ